MNYASNPFPNIDTAGSNSSLLTKQPPRKYRRINHNDSDRQGQYQQQQLQHQNYHVQHVNSNPIQHEQRRIPCNGIVYIPKCSNPIIDTVNDVIKRLSNIRSLQLASLDDATIASDDSIDTEVDFTKKLLSSLNKLHKKIKQNTNESKLSKLGQDAYGSDKPISNTIVQHLHGILLHFAEWICVKITFLDRKRSSSLTIDTTQEQIFRDVCDKLLLATLKCLIQLYSTIMYSPNGFIANNALKRSQRPITHCSNVKNLNNLLKLELNQSECDEMFDRNVRLYMKIIDCCKSPDTKMQDSTNVHSRSIRHSNSIDSRTIFSDQSDQVVQSNNSVVGAIMQILTCIVQYARHSTLSDEMIQTFLLSIFVHSVDVSNCTSSNTATAATKRIADSKNTQLFANTLLQCLSKNTLLEISELAKVSLSILQRGKYEALGYQYIYSILQFTDVAFFGLQCALTKDILYASIDEASRRSDERIRIVNQLILVINQQEQGLYKDRISRNKLYAAQCLLLVAQSVVKNITTSNDVDSNCYEIVVKEFLQILLMGNEDKRCNRVAIEGLHACVHSFHQIHNKWNSIQQSTINNFTSKTTPNINKQARQRGNVEHPAIVITNNKDAFDSQETLGKNLLYNLLAKPATMKKAISTVFDSVVCGLQQLGRINDKNRYQIDSVQKKGCDLLLDLVYHSLTLYQRSVNLLPASSTSDKVYNEESSQKGDDIRLIQPSEIVSIHVTIIDSGCRYRMHRSGLYVLESSVQSLCKVLMELYSTSTRSVPTASIQLAFNVFAKVLSDNYSSGLRDRARICILQALYCIMRVSSSQSQFAIAGVWLEACVSNPDLMEAIARECYTVRNNTNDAADSIDDKRRRKLAAAIISFLSKNPCSRRILAKQPNIISSMIRFIQGYDAVVVVQDGSDDAQQQIKYTDSLSMSSIANAAFRKRVEKQMLSLANIH